MRAARAVLPAAAVAAGGLAVAWAAWDDRPYRLEYLEAPRLGQFTFVREEGSFTDVLAVLLVGAVVAMAFALAPALRGRAEVLRYARAAVGGCAALWVGGLALDVMLLPFAALCTLLALFVMAAAGGAPRPLTAALGALAGHGGLLDVEPDWMFDWTEVGALLLTVAAVALAWELIRAPGPLPPVRWLAAAGAGWVIVAGLVGWSLIDILTEEDDGLGSAPAVAVPATGVLGLAAAALLAAAGRRWVPALAVTPVIVLTAMVAAELADSVSFDVGWTEYPPVRRVVLRAYAPVTDPDPVGLLTGGLDWSAAGPAVGVLLLLLGLVALLPDRADALP